jgi:COP9 signalosome complex subunit 5
MDPYPSSSSSIAQKTWELENNIKTIDTSTPTIATGTSFLSDAIFHYDDAAQAKFLQENPWSNDPNYFRRVRISALALLKMVVHARSGGTIEVMGLMQGKTDGDSIIVMDAFALPVEGTETRVNAQADAYEYMVDYSQTNKQVCLLIAFDFLFYSWVFNLKIIAFSFFGRGYFGL